MKPEKRRHLFSILCLLFSPLCILQPVLADEAAELARADFYYRHRQFSQALDELGRLSEENQEDPLFRQRVDRALAALYKNEHRVPAGWTPASSRFIHKFRGVFNKQDADNRSDQSFDSHGWQADEHLEADVEGRPELHSHFVMDLTGFRDGHNDLRYRTVLADFYHNASHLALGDSSTYPTPYFLRGSRLRGAHFLWNEEVNEFQLLGGAYPHWLADRDEYIYPRTVLGIRDRVRLLEDRIRFGANLVQTRDNEKIRTIDVANHPRDNIVASLDQELKLIPEVWSLKAAESYSVTSDDLEEFQDRFGRTRKLKDTAFTVESLFIQPLFRWQSRFERTGPDFRILTDLPSDSFARVKGITADRQLIDQRLGFKPIGPVDLDLEASWIRNNLDHDDTLNHIRQAWYTANLGFLTPPGWPKPRLRETMTETVSEPRSTIRRPHNLSSETNVEISKRFWKTDGSIFGSYWLETRSKAALTTHKLEERWSAGTRLSQPIGDRLVASTRYQYELENVDDVSSGALLLSRGHSHESNNNLSIRLWSTASFGLGYTYSRRRATEQLLSGRILPLESHSTDVSLTWPYTHENADKRRKLSLFPGVNYHWSNFSHDQRNRSVVGSQLRLAYEVYRAWKLELTGEYRYDKDDDNTSVRTAGSRLWLVWSSEWR